MVLERQPGEKWNGMEAISYLNPQNKCLLNTLHRIPRLVSCEVQVL
jgi:hypothetical protein